MVNPGRRSSDGAMDIFEREMSLWSEALGSRSDVLTLESENASAAPSGGFCGGEQRPGAEAREQGQS